ncbi:MAG: tetratricopeptide repeat protein [Hyphomicrobium sp.]|nr:tetratricopeptide repeat protein [Hyphomicrobium sp.]
MRFGRKLRTLALIGLLMLAGQLSQTINYYEALASLSVARTLRINGFPSAAIQFYSFAMYCAPQASKIVQARGVAYYQKRDYARAITDLTASLTLDPNDAASLLFRGAAYAHQKHYDEAVIDYSEAIRLAPDDPDGLIGRASVHLQRKNYDRAVADYSELIRLEPKSAGHYLSRANALSIADKPREALSDFDQAIALTQNDIEAGFLLLRKSYVREAMGDIAGAFSDIDQGEQRACAGLPATARCFKRFARAREHLKLSSALPAKPQGVSAAN